MLSIRCGTAKVVGLVVQAAQCNDGSKNDVVDQSNNSRSQDH